MYLDNLNRKGEADPGVAARVLSSSAAQQVVEAKEKTSFCSSLRFLICKLTLTPAG
jgi:hypothetical protein